MSIYSTDNRYRGVNAHLHTYFQSMGGWSSFHTTHITDLARMLNALLPPNYLVDVEQSLQIREYHPDTGERLRRPEPDLTIYQTGRGASAKSASSYPATLTQPLTDTMDLDEDLYYSAVLIYETDADGALGTPVTRVELLSPTNKRGEGFVQYREKRITALKSGLRLVEVDYLHETPSVIKGLPRYPQAEGSHPYHIIVSNPHPSFEAGIAQTYSFNVDEPIPTTPIPLGDTASIMLDWNALYNQTFTSLTAYSRRVDYVQLPERFHTYSLEDQTRIQQRMATA